jgi:hypothetical protein
MPEGAIPEQPSLPTNQGVRGPPRRAPETRGRSGRLHREVDRATEGGIGDGKALRDLGVRSRGSRRAGAGEETDHLVSLRLGDVEALGENRHRCLVLGRGLLHSNVHLRDIDVHGCNVAPPGRRVQSEEGSTQRRFVDMQQGAQ